MTSTPTRAATILVGYTPTPEGTAALAKAALKAQQRQAHLPVLNTGKGGNYADAVFASEQDIDAVTQGLAEAGVPHTICRPNDDSSSADSLLGTAVEIGADLTVVGLRRRRSPGGQAHHGFDRPGGAGRGRLPCAGLEGVPQPSVS